MLVYLLLTLTVLLIALNVKSRQQECVAGVSGDYNYIYRGITRERLKSSVGIFAIFVLLTGVSSIRLNVGNDYSNYVEFMHRAFSGAIVPTEPGFNYLTILIYKISGFENYVAVFFVFAAATVFFFLAAIRKRSEDFWMSFMMFMLLGYYFQSISTVRWYLALSIAIFSAYYCIERDWPKFVLLVLVGALFHKSLLVVLVLYPMACIKWRRWMLGALGIMCLSTLFLKDFYLQVAIKLYPSYAGTEYLNTTGLSKVNIIRCLAVAAFGIYVLRKDITKDREFTFYFYCNIFAFLLYTFGSFIPTVSRIAYYLTVTHLFYIPMLINRVDEKMFIRTNIRTVLKVVTVAICVVYFIGYMRGAGNDGVRILPYETIFFHELPATLSERGFG
ncbi:MAG: EpsG family protein [Butyrivibrio sp.]|nr:EpsG family protein [Butyrivibrio sp.]